MIEIIPNWHPIFVHFTIGLLGTAVLFFLLSILLPASDGLKTNWQIVARWCLWTGMAVTLLTVVAGYFAYNTVAHDSVSHAAMTEHRNWAFATVGAFTVVTFWSFWLHHKKQVPGLIFLVVAIVSGGLLASTGWHGGEVVYRYGLGVMSLPQIDTESIEGGHAHEYPEVSGHNTNSKHLIKTDQKSGDGQNHTYVNRSVSNVVSIPETRTGVETDLRSRGIHEQKPGNEGHAHHSDQPHAH